MAPGISTTSLGKQEILYRRIGENELETVDALHSIVDAQKEYYSQAPPGDGAHVYAARFDSDQGDARRPLLVLDGQ